MKRRFLLALVLSLVMVFSFSALALANDIDIEEEYNDYAPELVSAYDGLMVARASEWLDSLTVGIKASAGKKITITFTVKGTGVMTEVGVSKIRLYKDNSLNATIYPTSSNGLMGYNARSHAGSWSCTGVAGSKYVAIVTGYAANSTGSDGESLTTGVVTCIN